MTWGSLLHWLGWAAGIVGVGGIAVALVVFWPAVVVALPVLVAVERAAAAAARWAGAQLARAIDAAREQPRVLILIAIAAVGGYVAGSIRAYARAAAQHADYVERRNKADADAKAAIARAADAKVTAAEKARREAGDVAYWARRNAEAAKREVERTWQLFAAPQLPQLAAVQAPESESDYHLGIMPPSPGKALPAPQAAQEPARASPVPRPRPVPKRPPAPRSRAFAAPSNQLQPLAPKPASWPALVTTAPPEASIGDLVRRALGWMG